LGYWRGSERGFLSIDSEWLVLRIAADRQVVDKRVEWDEITQVYCEDTVNFKVVQGGRTLECGHQRQVGPY
jgi:hypothetical protein